MPALRQRFSRRCVSCAEARSRLDTLLLVRDRRIWPLPLLPSRTSPVRFADGHLWRDPLPIPKACRCRGACVPSAPPSPPTLSARDCCQQWHRCRGWLASADVLHLVHPVGLVELGTLAVPDGVDLGLVHCVQRDVLWQHDVGGLGGCLQFLQRYGVVPPSFAQIPSTWDRLPRPRPIRLR
jgi:hypothetical protein